MADKNKVHIDDILQHELYLARVATGGINSILLPSLAETYKAVKAILDAKGMPRTNKQMAELEAQIAKAVSSNSGWSMMTDSMNELAVYEVGFTSKLVGAAVTTSVITPTEKKIIDYVNQSYLDLSSGKRVNTGLWAKFIEQNDSHNTELINNIVRSGYTKEETVAQVTKSLRDSVNGIIKSDAESLARTGYSHFTNTARDSWADSNSDLDLLAHAVFTFDNRISSTCKFLSTQKTVWEMDDKKRPLFPAHFNCRSLYVYLPRGVEIDGIRPAIGGQSGKEAAAAFEKRDERTDKKVRYRGRKDTNIFDVEQISAKTPLESWMKQQPAWFIDDSLGVTKGKLFRSGEYKLESFYSATGKELTIPEIRARDESLFNRIIGGNNQ